jgi:hypothetical protein
MRTLFHPLKKACQWFYRVVLHGRKRNNRVCFEELLHSDLFKRLTPSDQEREG